MSLENRLALLENQVHEIVECLEQIARDADLMGVNVMRTLKGTQPQTHSNAPRQWTWNPDKIKWQQDTGFKGPYEKSDDVNSLDFKAMLKDLQEHRGKLNRDGRFYWTFKSGSTVGRTMPK